MKLLIMQSSPTSCHFLSLWSNYSPQHPVLPPLNPGSSLNVRDKVSCPYKTTCKIMVFYILIFKFLGRRQGDKRL
jgi:hypothetical protein